MNAEKMVVLYEDASPVAILTKAFHILTVNEVNAESHLEFDLYFTDPKRIYLKNQIEVHLGEGVYKIKTITDKKQAGSAKVSHVYAEDIYYDLARAARKDSVVFDTAKAITAMSFALQGTSWNIGEVTITSTKSFESNEKNPLAVLQLIADVFHAELLFHSDTKTVDLVKEIGNDTGMIFHFKKNMKSIERTVDTSSLITRLYATGKDAMTFASMNNGMAYVEDFSFSKEMLIGTLDCSNFTDKGDMLDYTKLRLANYCKPSYSYKLSVLYLQDVNGYRHESYGLGDPVRVIDEELGIDIITRIVRMEKDILNPWNTVVELSSTIGTLSLSDADLAASAIEAVLKSFVAPRLMQATVNTKSGEINAMYELGVPVKYIFTQRDDGILFLHPDGLTCEIKII